jgi:hypothetical protein
MATHEILILGSNTIPDTSGDVFLEPYSIKDTGTAIDPMVWIFNDSGAKIGLRGSFQVPQNYVGTAKSNIYWNANATTGDVVWDLSYLTRTSGEDMGAAATDTTDTVTTSTNATAFNLNKSTMTLTSGDFAAGDIVTFEVFRDGLSGSDTLAVAAIMFIATFEYADV